MQTKVTYYGHAALGLQIGDHQLLVDPYFTDEKARPDTTGASCPSFILITHGHGDHVGDSEAIAKRCDATCISNYEIANWLSAKGVKTSGQQIGGGFKYPFGYLKMTHALHSSSLPDGTYGGNPGGYLLTTPSGKKIYMAGDTGLFYDMVLIGEEGIDLAVLPVGDYYTMGPDDALRAIKLLDPKVVIPIHFNTFEVISQDVNAWKERVEAETSAKVKILRPGEHYILEE